jgi:hypothetical protein
MHLMYELGSQTHCYFSSRIYYYYKWCTQVLIVNIGTCSNSLDVFYDDLGFLLYISVGGRVSNCINCGWSSFVCIKYMAFVLSTRHSISVACQMLVDLYKIPYWTRCTRSHSW